MNRPDHSDDQRLCHVQIITNVDSPQPSVAGGCFVLSYIFPVTKNLTSQIIIKWQVNVLAYLIILTTRFYSIRLQNPERPKRSIRPGIRAVA